MTVEYRCLDGHVTRRDGRYEVDTCGVDGCINGAIRQGRPIEIRADCTPARKALWRAYVSLYQPSRIQRRAVGVPLLRVSM